MIQPVPSRFALEVPLDPRYRGLGAEIAGRYAEVIGGSPADAEALAASVTDAMARLSDGAPAEAGVQLDFAPSPAGVVVTLRCAGQSATVTHRLPAGKP